MLKNQLVWIRFSNVLVTENFDLSKILLGTPFRNKEFTYAEILSIYQLNSGKFLRHGSLYYT